jgi:hypothetical protein
MLDRATLIKVAHLAVSGEGGEQEAALQILAAQGEDAKELLEDEKLVWSTISYRDKRERTLAFQCFFRVTGETEVSYIRRQGRKVDIEILEHQKPAFEALVSKILKSWRKELDLFMTAFVERNSLFSANAPEGKCKLSQEDIDKIIAMAAGITPTPQYLELKA